MESTRRFVLGRMLWVRGKRRPIKRANGKAPMGTGLNGASKSEHGTAIWSDVSHILFTLHVPGFSSHQAAT